MSADDYRVELFNDSAAIKGMRSYFAKHVSLEDAKLWAIERGKFGGANYIRLYKKSVNRYNHYIFVVEINLI